MKKISMFFMATAMMFFVACGGGEKKSDDSATTTEETTTTVEQTSTPQEASGSDIVAKYQAICDKMVELAPKMKSGDVNAVQEYQKVAQEFANFAQENQEAFSKLSEADALKIQEIAQKAAAAMQ